MFAAAPGPSGEPEGGEFKHKAIHQCALQLGCSNGETDVRMVLSIQSSVSGFDHLSGRDRKCPEWPTSFKEGRSNQAQSGYVAANAPISVIPLHGPEEFGVFLSRDQEGFTFRDIDSKIDVTMKYSEVRKLKNGYGGYNSIKGRHTDRTKAIVVTVAVLGALGVLIGAAAAAKN